MAITPSKIRLALFASGGGSNAEKIIQYFEHHNSVKVCLVVSNKPDAGALKIAKDYGINSLIIKKHNFYNTNEVLVDLVKARIDYIILAGFLWLIPRKFVDAYPNKILNIHPSLLPKYGGKGMYGHFVHEAVKNNNESESGMTIHLVNENFDDGDIVFQAKCALSPNMEPSEIAAKVLELEHSHYAQVIENYVLNHGLF